MIVQNNILFIFEKNNLLMNIKIGVMASEFYKTFFRKTLNKMKYTELLKAIKHVVKVLHNLDINCYEFCINDSNSMSKLLKVLERIGEVNTSIQFHDMLNSIKLAYKDVEERQKAFEDLIKMIEIAHDYDITILTIHPAYYKPSFKDYIYSPHAEKSLEYNKGYSIMIDLLKKLSNYANKKGVTLALENMESYIIKGNKIFRSTHYGCTKSEILDILKRVNNNSLKITFDIGHANLTYEKPINFCKGIVHLIVNIHIHDNNGQMDEHKPIGLGNIDFESVFKTLINEGYNGSIIIERGYDKYIIEDIKKIKKFLKLVL